jgi:hypothetical protein
MQELLLSDAAADTGAGSTSDDAITAVENSNNTTAESSESALLRKCAAVASAAVDALQCGKPVLQLVEHGDLPPHSTVDHVITFTPNRIGTVTQVTIYIFVYSVASYILYCCCIGMPIHIRSSAAIRC